MAHRAISMIANYSCVTYEYTGSCIIPNSGVNCQLIGVARNIMQAQTLPTERYST